MKIIVCVKQVPDTETRVRIGPDGGSIVEGDVNWIVSPFDEFAVEEALRQKEAHGGEVILISAGPDRVASALRSGLAMGADSFDARSSGDHGRPSATTDATTHQTCRISVTDRMCKGAIDTTLQQATGLGATSSRTWRRRCAGGLKSKTG
jgi:hypothetical protein